MIAEVNAELAPALALCAVYGIWGGTIFGLIRSLFK